jgi:hypothetical protein
VGKTTILLSFFSPQKQKGKLNVDWWILMSYLFEDKILKKLFLHLEAFKAGQKMYIQQRVVRRVAFNLTAICKEAVNQRYWQIITLLSSLGCSLLME